MLSIVIPAHNEEEGIANALAVIQEQVKLCQMDWEIIVVDDGSYDSTFNQVKALSTQNRHLKAIKLSRNFGKEGALFAGLRAASGDAVITIDADLQHPPELIPKMVDEWKKGVKVVDAVKRCRKNDSVIARYRAKLFNTLISKLSGINLENSSDFKLVDRTVVDLISFELPERQRFYRGLSDWVGYDHTSIEFDVANREAGEGKWGIIALLNLAVTALVSFTSAPLRIVTLLGFLAMLFGFVVAVEALFGWIQGEAVSGFTTTIITILVLGSLIMISLGIIGEYIAKIYDEIKARPAFLISETVGIDLQEQQTNKNNLNEVNTQQRVNIVP